MNNPVGKTETWALNRSGISIDTDAGKPALGVRIRQEAGRGGREDLTARAKLILAAPPMYRGIWAAIGKIRALADDFDGDANEVTREIRGKLLTLADELWQSAQPAEPSCQDAKPAKRRASKFDGIDRTGWETYAEWEAKKAARPGPCSMCSKVGKWAFYPNLYDDRPEPTLRLCPLCREQEREDNARNVADCDGEE